MKILLVEDTASHADDAKALFESLGLEYIHVCDLTEAERALEQIKTNGITHVITDLFFRQGRAGNSNGSEAMNFEYEPCGVAVMLWARELNLPAAICTDGCHHAARLDWITMMGRRLGWPEMADNRKAHRVTDVASKKEWELALETIGLESKLPQSA